MEGRVDPPSSPTGEWNTLVVASGEGIGDGVEPELAIDRALGPGEAIDVGQRAGDALAVEDRERIDDCIEWVAGDRDAACS